MNKKAKSEPAEKVRIQADPPSLETAPLLSLHRA